MRIGPVDWRPGDGYSEIELPDGRVISAVPHATDDYAAQATRLSYLDGAAMSREHDAIHSALAAVFGATSPVLRAVADLEGAALPGYRDRRRPVGAERHWQEECLVEIVSIRLNDPARDGEPGGGFIAWLRGLLRAPEIGPVSYVPENQPT